MKLSWDERFQRIEVEYDAYLTDADGTEHRHTGSTCEGIGAEDVWNEIVRLRKEIEGMRNIMKSSITTIDGYWDEIKSLKEENERLIQLIDWERGMHECLRRSGLL